MMLSMKFPSSHRVSQTLTLMPFHYFGFYYISIFVGHTKNGKNGPKKTQQKHQPYPPFPPHLQGPFLTVKNRVPTTDSTFTTPPGPASLGRTPE